MASTNDAAKRIADYVNATYPNPNINRVKLPEPSCPQGYTHEDLDNIIEDREDFNKWMRGQTMGICDGFQYNHDTEETELSPCGIKDEAHGTIIYTHDVRRYVERRPVID